MRVCKVKLSQMHREHVASAALLIAAMLGFAVTAQSAPSLAERKERIESMGTNVVPEALRRKERSENILRTEGVPVNKSLPVIETEKEAHYRSKDEVAHRALALLVVAVKGEGSEQPRVDKVIKNYGLQSFFSTKERRFVDELSPSEHDRIQFSWRYEAAWVLLWALGYVEKLEKPAGICDVQRAVKFMSDRTSEQFIAGAKLRPLREVLDEADRIYRYHWAVVDARINGRSTPAGLELGVTMERHYALNWLIGYMGQEWDEVTTDT